MAWDIRDVGLPATWVGATNEAARLAVSPPAPDSGGVLIPVISVASGNPLEQPVPAGIRAGPVEDHHPRPPSPDRSNDVATDVRIPRPAKDEPLHALGLGAALLGRRLRGRRPSARTGEPIARPPVLVAVEAIGIRPRPAAANEVLLGGRLVGKVRAVLIGGVSDRARDGRAARRSAEHCSDQHPCNGERDPGGAPHAIALWGGTTRFATPTVAGGRTLPPAELDGP
jgi:hypothetical protein